MMATAPVRDSGRWRRPIRTRRCTAATIGASTYAKNADKRKRTPTPSIGRSMRRGSYNRRDEHQDRSKPVGGGVAVYAARADADGRGHSLSDYPLADAAAADRVRGRPLARHPDDPRRRRVAAVGDLL